jgi:four helix bundle protein
MILNLQHKKLNVFQLSRTLLKEAYKLADLMPAKEDFNFKQQIHRAALSIILNISEGASRQTPSERRQYYIIARGSLIEIDSAIQAAADLGYINAGDTFTIAPVMNQLFAMLSKMISTLSVQT